VTNLMDIFFVKEKEQIKVHISVDTSHLLPGAHSLPLTRALGMARKTCKSSRGWR
jgi:hypothetical protein